MIIANRKFGVGVRSIPDIARRRPKMRAATAAFFGIILGVLTANVAQANVTLTGASGGTALSTDTARNAASPSWTTLGPITLAENNNGDFAVGTNVTLIIKTPAGFEYNTAVAPDVTFTTNRNLTNASAAVTDSSTLTITFTVIGTTGDDALNIGTLTGIQVRPTAGTPLATGKHLYRPGGGGGGTAMISGISTSADGSNGSNFGTLTEVVGTPAKLFVTLPNETFTAPTGNSGTVLTETAGTAFTITKLTAVDSFTNIATSYAGAKTISYSGPGGTPTYVTAVNFTSGQSTTTLTTILPKAETTTITASASGLSGVPSSSLTVKAGAFAKLQLLVPGETAVPGTTTGKSGAPLAQTNGQPFSVAVNGVDANWNAIVTNDTIKIISSDASALLPNNAALSGGSQNFAVTLRSIGAFTVTASNVTHVAIGSSTSPAITVVNPLRGGPVVAIHDSELTRALELVPASNPGTPTGAGASGYEWWPTNWHYFVMPEALKEALRSDGTAFEVVSDADISGGRLLTNGQPRYPILISLASEAVRDDEISQLTNYVAAGGTLLAGSSSFTRQTNGIGRGDFALANAMGLHTVSSNLQNWAANTTFAKTVPHRLTAHIPSGTLTWRLPTSADEVSWGISPAHAITAGSAMWQVQASDATVIAQGNGQPYLAVKSYGKGTFVYHAAMQPLIGHGGNSPGMYAYVIFRNAIEAAYGALNNPVVRVSPWPYPYDAAFAVRHDFEDYQNLISAVEASAQFESANGAKGDYYFCTGTLRVEMTNVTATVASLQRAVTNYGATIGPHNGGLKNPNNTNLVVASYDYWHWGPDEALDVTPAGYPNGKAYAMASVSNSFTDVEGWLAGLTNGLRSTVAPYFNATRENSYDILEQLGVKTAGEQKLSPFPHWTLSTQTSGKRYSAVTLPVSDWYVGLDIGQATENGHSSASVHALVDYYYALGALINLYSHSSADGQGAAGALVQNYITYGMSKPRVWPVNATTIYNWWNRRNGTQIAPSFSISNTLSIATVRISGTNDPQSTLEFVLPKSYFTALQVFTNGASAPASAYRTNNQTVKVAIGASVTNAEIRYLMPPAARDDSYQVVANANLVVPASGLLANDSTGLGTNLSAILVSGPANGSVSLSTNGGFTYIPATNFDGVDSFSYKANDGVSDSAAATVTLFVSPTLSALFSDDFTRTNDPGSLSPWVAQSGNWTITGGALQGGTNSLQSYGTLYRSGTWSNYTVEARIQFPAGAYGGGVGARLNSANGARYAAWVYPEGSPGGSNVLKLIKFQNWTGFGYNGFSSVPMQQVNLPAVGTNSHTVKLALDGNQLSVFYDQNQMISMSDAEAQPYTTGGVTLEMWTDNAGYVMGADDVVVSGPVASQTITFNTPANPMYGAAPIALSAQASSGLPVNFRVVSGPAVVTGTNLLVTGTGAVTVRASQSGDSSFKAAPAVDQSFTVNPAIITVAAANKTKIYGAALPSLTANYTGFVNGETTAVLAGAPALSTGALASSPVGNYAITAALGSLSATNYTFAFVNGQLAITPATLTVTGDNLSRPFGVTNPPLTATISGFVNSDNSSVVSGTPTLACTALTNSLPGQYPISVGTGTLAAANYNFATVNGTLTVQPARVAFFDDFSRTNDPASTPPWIVRSGNWSITGGVMAAGTNTTLSYGFAYITNSWADYSVEARIRFPAGAFGGGVGGRLNPATGAHYGAWVYPEGSIGGSNVLKLVKFQDWNNFGYNGVNLAPVQQVSLSSVGTNWHSVQLTFQGSQISVYFDFVLMITATDAEATPYTNGAVSLDLWTDASPYVMKADEVTVTTPLAAQTITFDPLNSKTYGDAPLALSASASSGLPVALSVFSGPATLNGSTLTITGAGNVTIRASQAGNDSYMPALSVDRSFAVNPAPLTIAANAQNKNYGATDPALTHQITAGALVGSDSLSGSLSRVAGETVGSYAIGQGTLSAGSNYALTFVPSNLTINPAPLTVTADPQSKLYGGPDPALTYQITAGALVGGDLLTGALTRFAGETVGAYAIQQGTVSAGTNYLLTFNSANLTITPTPLVVTADAKAKTYGATDPALTYQITGGALVGSDVLSGSLTRVAGETVGNRAITQGTLSAGTNYSLTFNSANFTITPAALSVTADAKTKVYGAGDPEFTYQITSGALVGTDSFSGSLSRVIGETFGNYAIQQGTLSAGTNYTLTFNAANLSITRAALTVAADAKTKVYGASDPALTYQITSGALVGGDSFSGFLTRVGGETVGSYPINQGTLSAGTNYTLTFNSTNLAINPAPLTVSADPRSKVYGDADPALTYHITSGALVSSDTLSGSLTRVAGENVGSYAINQGTLTAGTNYVLTYNSANLSITPRALVAQADNKARVYGTPNPVFTITYSGFVGSDTVTNLAVLPLASTLAQTNSPIGAYNITVSGGSDTNYGLVLSNGTLTVTAVALTVTADPESKVYGTADPTLTYHITGGGLVTGDGFSGSLTRGAGETVGNYAIQQGTLTAGTNYTLTFNSTNLAITPAPLTVAADSKTKTYGTTDPALTYHITSGALVFSDSLSGLLSRVAGETVGAYAINQGSLSAGTNYSLTFNSANLTITPAGLSVTADAKTKVYGAADPALTYQITSGALVGGDSLSGALSRVAGQTVGAYSIQQGTLTAGTNYTLTFNATNLVITPAPLTVAADATSKVYGATDPSLTYQITSGALIGTDSLSGSLTRAAGENVGSYAINQGTLTAGTNYALTYNSANLSITARALLAQADSMSRVYGATNPIFTIAYSGFVGADTVTNLATLPVASTAAQTNSPIGAYDIILNGGGDTNYSLVLSNGTLTVTTAALTVTADPKSKTYGAAEPALTYQITSGALMPGDSVGGSLGRSPGETVGSYQINQGTVTAGINYTLTFNTANLTITPAPLAVAADAKTKVYGAPDPALTYHITSGALVGSDVLSGGLVRAEGENIGSYAINQGTVTAGTNYTMTYNSANLTIDTAPLTVAADSKTKIYGTVDPALTYHIASGALVGSDSLGGSLIRISGETVGAYGINQGSLSAGTNYALTFISTNFVINPAPLNISADAKSKVYGSADPALTYHISSGALIGADSISGSLSRVAGENAGTYAINQGTLTAGTNYALTYNSTNLSITPRALLAQADNQSRVYGATNPVFTMSYSGFIGSDSVTNLAVLPVASTLAQTNSPIGTYDITLSGGNDTNYSLVLSNGTLSVTAAAVTVTADPKSKVYGASDPALTYQITSGALAGTDSLSGSLSRVPGETVGAYAINQGSLSAGTNYSLTFNPANLAITPAALSVAADAKAKLYGAADPALTYQITSGALVGSDTLSGSLSRVAGETVGNYAINQGLLTAGTNYTLTFVSTNLVINPAPLTVSADARSKVYGDADPALTYHISSGSLIGGDNLAGSLTRVAGENVGSYAINQGTLTAGTNYALTYNSANLSIASRTLLAQADNQSRAYGTTNPVFTISYSGFVGSQSVTNLAVLPLASTTAQTNSPVGTYDITLSGGSDTNYSFVLSNGTLIVTTAALTITADAKSKVYGAADPVLTYQITSGALVGGESLNGSLARVAGETVGNYAINEGTLTAGTNYTLAFISTNLVINPAPLAISADAKSKVYGATDPVLTYQISSGALVGSDSLSGSLSRAAGENVGSYAINQGTLAAGTNYALIYNSANLSITPRALLAQADNQNRPYGTTNPVFTISYSGFIGSESVTNLALLPLASTAAQTNSPVGTYDITLSGGSDTNYSFVLSNSTLIVTTAALTVTPDAKSKVYGAADPALTYQITSGALIDGDVMTGSLTRASGENVGSYAINQGTLTAGTNYALTIASANLVITPRALLAQADNQSRVYGATNPVFTITYSGFVGSDSVTNLALLPVASTLAQTNSPIGAYDISVSGGSDTNYSFVLSNGTLTVTSAVLAVTADPRTKVYGATDPALTYQITSGSLLAGDSITGSLSRVVGETVGSYPINQGTLTAGTNYTLTFNSTNLAITPAPLTVSADPRSKVYGTADPALTYQITSGALVGTDVLSGTLVRLAGEGVGNYAINQGTLSAGTNYTLTFNPATLSITPAALTVTADAKSKIYGAADPALSYQIISGVLLNGDSLAGALARAPGETVGNYPINQGTLAASTNYTLTFNSANLTITAAQSTNALTSSQNPSVQGSNVTFTATLGPVAPAVTIPTGSVQFLTNGAPLGGPVALVAGVANINTALLPSGSNTITAIYAGDTNFAGSTNTLAQVVTAVSQRPQTLGLKNNGDGTVTVTFAGVPGAQYVVQATANLAPASWVNISTNVAGPDGFWTITDSITNRPQRFYRSAKLQSTTSLAPDRPSTLGLKDNLDGTVTAAFAGTPGAQYVVQATDSLVPPITWVDISTNIAAPDGHWKYTESTAGHPNRFYRAAYIPSALQNGGTVQPPQDAGIRNNGNGTLTISFTGTPNAQYLVQAASTLNLPLNWTTIATITAGSDGRYSYTDSIGNFMLRYYRSVIP